MNPQENHMKDAIAIKIGHDRCLREQAEREHGGWISDSTWEMMKKNGEAHGCGCEICSRLYFLDEIVKEDKQYLSSLSQD